MHARLSSWNVVAERPDRSGARHFVRQEGGERETEADGRRICCTTSRSCDGIQKTGEYSLEEVRL